MFIKYLLVGWGLVLIQFVAAYFDGWLTQSQLQQRDIKGGALVEILAVWADVIIICPVVAYLFSGYCSVLTSKTGLVFLGIIVICCVALGRMFSAKATSGVPDAWNHYGTTTIAGYGHGVFAIVCAWALVTFYLTTPSGTPLFHRDLVWISAVMTPFFYLGIARTTEGWSMDGLAWINTIAGPVIVWTVALIRIYVIDPNRH